MAKLPSKLYEAWDYVTLSPLLTHKLCWEVSSSPSSTRNLRWATYLPSSTCKSYGRWLRMVSLLEPFFSFSTTSSKFPVWDSSSIGSPWYNMTTKPNLTQTKYYPICGKPICECFISTFGCTLCGYKYAVVCDICIEAHNDFPTTQSVLPLTLPTHCSKNPIIRLEKPMPSNLPSTACEAALHSGHDRDFILYCTHIEFSLIDLPIDVSNLPPASVPNTKSLQLPHTKHHLEA